MPRSIVLDRDGFRDSPSSSSSWSDPLGREESSSAIDSQASHRTMVRWSSEIDYQCSPEGLSPQSPSIAPMVINGIQNVSLSHSNGSGVHLSRCSDIKVESAFQHE